MSFPLFSSAQTNIKTQNIIKRAVETDREKEEKKTSKTLCQKFIKNIAIGIAVGSFFGSFSSLIPPLTASTNKAESVEFIAAAHEAIISITTQGGLGAIKGGLLGIIHYGTQSVFNFYDEKIPTFPSLYSLASRFKFKKS